MIGVDLQTPQKKEEKMINSFAMGEIQMLWDSEEQPECMCNFHHSCIYSMYFILPHLFLSNRYLLFFFLFLAPLLHSHLLQSLLLVSFVCWDFQSGLKLLTFNRIWIANCLFFCTLQIPDIALLWVHFSLLWVNFLKCYILLERKQKKKSAPLSF